MIAKFEYKSARGDIIHLGRDGIYANYNDLLSYNWIYGNANGKITGFTKEIAEKTIPTLFTADTAKETALLRMKTHEIFERDVRSGTPGTIIIGDYALSCYIIAANNVTISRTGRFIRTTWAIVTDDPFWRKSSVLSFTKVNQQEASDDGLGYPYAYPYGYASISSDIGVLENPFPFASDFEMTIYGPATNPRVEIDGVYYGITRELGAGERLVIDSVGRSVVMYGSVAETNYFGYRIKENDVFQSIPPGANHISWDGSFGFNIALTDARSEPPIQYVDTGEDQEDEEQAGVITMDGYEWLTLDGFSYVVE